MYSQCQPINVILNFFYCPYYPSNRNDKLLNKNVCNTNDYTHFYYY